MFAWLNTSYSPVRVDNSAARCSTADTCWYTCRRAAIATTAFSSIRFNVDPYDDRTGLRSWGASAHVAELNLYEGAALLVYGVGSNPGGYNQGDHTPNKAFDGDLATKWLDDEKKPLVLTFPAPVRVTSYEWATAYDNTAADPVKWSLEGSNDGISWLSIDHTHAHGVYPTSLARQQWQGPFIVPGANPTSPSV